MSKKLKPKELRKFQDFLRENYEICQICEVNPSQDLHHSQYGAGGRDDRTLVAVCRDCHYQIHHGSYDNIVLDRQEILQIGENNYNRFIIYTGRDFPICNNDKWLIGKIDKKIGN